MTVCDYAGYDYKKEFWEAKNRLYEDLCERQTVRKLFALSGVKPKVWMDAGCGFGRMFEAYDSYADHFILFDYAQHLLDQAAQTLKTEKSIRFVQGNLMEMPLEDSCTDVVMSVRTMHHLDKPEKFFAEAWRVLNPNGVFIFEIPNQRHILNIVRFLLGKLHANPFSYQQFQLNKAYFNYHPSYILPLLEKQGFKIQKTVSTSFFRSAVLKKLFPASFLVASDLFLQSVLSWVYLTPSVYVLAKKPVQ